MLQAFHLTQPAITCSKLATETVEQEVKYVQWSQMASFWCLYCWLWTYFAPCSRVSIVNFEQVNAGICAGPGCTFSVILWTNTCAKSVLLVAEQPFWKMI